MSYPALIQPLVIEDNVEMQDGYDFLFTEISKSISVAPSRYAFCHADGARELHSQKMFHVVILDLRLPEFPRMPSPDGVDFGLSLLKLCVKRDDYPIPALLVISGELDKTQQELLHTTVRESFAYGRVLVKSNLDALQEELLKAVEAAREYCGFGVHLKDAGKLTYPTISPREDDLIRRSVAHQISTGLDLAWWSAHPYDWLSEDTRKAWTKVLAGRFLYGGDAPSRLNFFKLIPSGEARPAIDSAKRMQAKLPHIKVNSTLVSDSRALMVTERVGSGDDAPMSLAQFLCTAKASSAGVLDTVAGQILSQVRSLGETGPRMKSFNQLLWPCHDLARITSQWEKFKRACLAGIQADPVILFQELVASAESIRVGFQSTVHGDLHIDNVAVDLIQDAVDAYIFDCASLSGHVGVRDLAYLETSALLHQQAADSVGLVQYCGALYDEFIPSDAAPLGPVVQANTWEFIRRLRENIGEEERRLYAFFVFDYALIQLGGLAFGMSQNKVQDPRETALLASLAAGWFRKLSS